VREYAYFALRNVFEVCTHEVFLDRVSGQTVDLVARGVKDNWSQVRYAASMAARAFMATAGAERERFFPELLGVLCLNRHYVAEGVRLYSQESWRMVVGPQGGARPLTTHMDTVIDAYVEAAEAPNHAVREAACHCIAEFSTRIAGLPDNPSPYREHFTQERVQRLLETLIGAFQDESWPVRDVASTALGHFVQSFPSVCEPYRGRLMDIWFEHLADNIPSMRKNGAVALAMAVEVWRTDVWDATIYKLRKVLPEALLQPHNSQIFTNYTPSGPFSVPTTKNLGDVPDPAHTNQTMYSCGSLAPKSMKKKVRKDAGCMNCDEAKPQQYWEASEGMVHLLAELAVLEAKGSSPSQAHLDVLASLLPEVARVLDCSQFDHHYLLKQRICERLRDITGALGAARMMTHLPAMLSAVAASASQEVHRTLRDNARELLACWRALCTEDEAKTICDAASLAPGVLLGA
jgi:hypothetical protein